MGIVGLGATKTVIGSNGIAITFRFWNQGTLQSEHALAAIVPGSLSNTLLQALGAVIDTQQQAIHATKVSRKSPIKVIERGLFILDSNDLVDTTVSLQAAETHRMSDELKETEPGSTQPRKHVMIQSQSNMNTNLTHMPLTTMNMPKTMIMFTIKIERVFSNSSWAVQRKAQTSYVR